MDHNKRLNILLTCDPELPVPPGKYGGIERIVEMLVKGLVDMGHEVTLCANGDSQVPCRLVAWKGAKSQHLPDTVRNLATLTSLVLRNRFDIVHSFSRLAYMGLIMPFKVPKIMSYQREPSVAQVKKAVQVSANGTIRFTGCSHYITNQIKPYAEASTVYNAAPFTKYELNATLSGDAPLVFLGRIEAIKGTHEAVQVAQKTGKRLVIAGNIPQEKQGYFDEKIKPHLSEQIQYIGPVNDAQKNVLLQKASALLMPIRWNEPFGIVMAEAMACGTPVIGLSKGAVPEVIDNGVSGFCCQSQEEMMQAVERLHCIDRRRVRQVAEERFSETVMVKGYLDLYASMLRRKTSKNTYSKNK